MTDTPNGYRALPWYSDGYRVYDADGIEVANTFTPELALGSAKAVAKDIVEAANAHYVGKDARIAELENRAEAAEADRDWYRSVAAHNKDAAMRADDSKEDAEKRAEARVKDVDRDRWHLLNRAEDAEARVRELERQLFDMEGRRTARELGLKKRTDEAEARVRELEQDYYLKARSVGFGWQARADM